jgi:hypothetical protein
MNLASIRCPHQPCSKVTTGDLMREGSTPASRARLVELMVEAQANLTIGDCGLDEMLNEMRSQMNRFIEENVAPHAHEWHCNNEYVPLEIIQKLAELGVFALTLPEEYDGMGLGKESMCLVSEELSRGWIAIGSLGTRPEIAAELILAGGTDEQKQQVAAEDRVRRDSAHRRFHRAQHRLRPGLAAHPRRQGRRCLQGHRQQDLDHPPCAR